MSDVKEIEYELVTDPNELAEADWERKIDGLWHKNSFTVGNRYPATISAGYARRPKRAVAPPPPPPPPPPPVDEHTKLLNYFLRRTDPAVIAARWPGGDE